MSMTEYRFQVRAVCTQFNSAWSDLSAASSWVYMVRELRAATFVEASRASIAVHSGVDRSVKIKRKLNMCIFETYMNIN